MDKDGYINLTDYGFSYNHGPNNVQYDLIGTPEYVAPEMVS